MTVEELIAFFGLPAQNIDFSDFLVANGIFERPIFDVDTENPMEHIQIPDRGLSLEFIRPISYSHRYGVVREDGEMIFAKIFVYATAEDEFFAYVGQVLPGVATNIVVEDALSRFGAPSWVRDEGDPFGRPNNIEYTWDNIEGFSIFIRFYKEPPSVRHMVISPAKEQVKVQCK